MNTVALSTEMCLYNCIGGKWKIEKQLNQLDLSTRFFQIDSNFVAQFLIN